MEGGLGGGGLGGGEEVGGVVLVDGVDYLRWFEGVGRLDWTGLDLFRVTAVNTALSR